MLFLRSQIFLIAFHVSILLQMIFWTPVLLFLSRRNGWNVAKFWAWSSLWLHNKILGTRFDFRGLENIPKEGGFIVACKHQSTWETYTILPFLEDPSYILKRELMFVPLFGWFAAKMKVIAVNRGKRGEALRAMSLEAKKQYTKSRQIIIYPEGTRRAAKAPAAYKYGVTHLYKEISPKVLPVALNSGMHWPRNSFFLKQGTIVMEFLEVIEPGLHRNEFAAQLENTIEKKTAELIEESENDPKYINSL